MLSRLSLCGNAGLSKCLVKYQPVLALATSAPVSADAPGKPADSGKRDLVNFPRRVMQEYAPPTRFGFIPESWFHFFYPKTGVTGPYIFMISVGTYLFSKEIVIIDHGTSHLLALAFSLYLLKYNLGDTIAGAYNNLYEESRKMIDDGQEQEKEQFREAIKDLEGKRITKEMVAEVVKAKREIVQFQMEAAYRERLAEAHKKVKNMLDCQVELQNVERRVAQKNLVDYVIRNVMKSITPDLEKSALQNCISNLNTLSAKS